MRVCIISRSRDERNIQEWVDYHLKIGFTDIFIYDDFSTPPISQVLAPNEHVHIIRLEKRVPIHPLFGGSGQGYKQLFQKISESGHEYDYILDIDTDEYLYLDYHKDINSLIEFYMPFDILLFNFMSMGNNGKIKRDTDSCINEFSVSDNKFAGWGKSLAKFDSIIKQKYSPHLFERLKPGINVVCKNVKNECVPNIQPIRGTEDINTNKIKIVDNEIVSCPPCVFHYSVTDIETFIEIKVNKKQLRIMNGRYVEITPFGGEYIDKSELEKIESEKEFIDLMKSKYPNTLDYYKIYCQNIVTNKLLYKKCDL